MEESARRAARAGEVLDAYIERAARMVRSAPPGAIAATMRVLLEVHRLEGGKSTRNVAVQLSPAERRRRIFELAGQLSEIVEADADELG